MGEEVSGYFFGGMGPLFFVMFVGVVMDCDIFFAVDIIYLIFRPEHRDVNGCCGEQDHGKIPECDVGNDRLVPACAVGLAW